MLITLLKIIIFVKKKMKLTYPGAKAIKISNRQLLLLEQYHKKVTISVREKLRTGVIIQAGKGIANKRVARNLGTTNMLVKRWRNRWSEAYEELCIFEQGSLDKGVSDTILLDKMLEILSDRYRSGKPKVITLEQEKQIVALACEAPSDYGIPITQWNRELLREVILEKKIVEKISPRYVSEILKKGEVATAPK